MAVPVTVILAFLFSAGRTDSPSSPKSSGPAPAVTVAAPPSPAAAAQRACVSVFAGLPVTLDGLAPRKTDTDSSFVAAWGNPAIVLRCGVPRPAVFNTADAAELIDVNGVIWQPEPQQKQVVFTAVDRSVYIEVTVPANVDQPLPTLAAAVKAIPQVCTAADANGRTTNSALPVCR